jgi:hypothetical protein
MLQLLFAVSAPDEDEDPQSRSSCGKQGKGRGLRHTYERTHFCRDTLTIRHMRMKRRAHECTEHQACSKKLFHFYFFDKSIHPTPLHCITGNYSVQQTDEQYKTLNAGHVCDGNPGGGASGSERSRNRRNSL